MEKAVKNIKGLVFSMIFFLLLTMVISLLIKFGPLPEKWSVIYILIALSLACMFIGLYMGYYLKKNGFLYGIGYAVLLLLIIVGASMSVLQTPLTFSLFYLRYLLCIFFGGVGGAIGVNLRN